MEYIEALKCPSCCFKTYSFAILKDHCETQHNIDPKRKYFCDKCPYTSAKRWKIIEHQKFHSDIPGLYLHACTLCSFRAPHKAQLERHIMFTHSHEVDLRKFSCKYCGETYTSKSALKQHRQKGHYV
uniref:Zinc finger protein 335-like n=1 Tax=Diabrotica virgifera virgifera TaxID=50390 RepID=A0A6P7FCV9_DIAVI